MADNLTLSSLVLLASEETTAKAKRSLLAESSASFILFLHNLCKDILFGKLAISDSERLRLIRSRQQLYFLVQLPASADSLRKEFRRVPALRALAAIASVALPSLLGPSVEKPVQDES